MDDLTMRCGLRANDMDRSTRSLDSAVQPSILGHSSRCSL